MTTATSSQAPSTATMRKVVVHKAGGYDRLKIEEGPAPAPGRGQVRIAVRAIGVNYADAVVRMGLYSSAKEYVGWPITPGFEVAGVIDAIGDEGDAIGGRVHPTGGGANATAGAAHAIGGDIHPTGGDIHPTGGGVHPTGGGAVATSADVHATGGGAGLAVGAEVFAVTRFGGYASHVVVDRAQVFPRPAATSFEQAAAIPAVYMTAWYALFELAHPRRGHKVLVHSAAGGVGGALLQLATVAGCEVVGVVGGSHKVASARALGAAHVIDKSTVDLWREAERLAPEGYDLILDANGVSTLGDSYAHLRRAGKLVVYGFHSMLPKTGGKPRWSKLAIDYVRTPRFNPLEMTKHSRSVLAFNLSYLFDRIDLMHEGLAQITGWLEAGAIVAPPVTTYPLAEVARAHADLESGRTIGKLVLLP